MKKLGFADPNHAQSLWQFEVSINGTTFASRPQVMPGSFSPNVIRVGGENMSDLHDMGVSGHLNTRYLLENGANLDLTFLADRTVNKLEDPRYFIDKGSGGFGDSEYFQTTTTFIIMIPLQLKCQKGLTCATANRKVLSAET
ncbi:MAG: hypothetical protein IPG72_07080 [Ardenticatenales bacterium]|nr:hypothetical protein [Ardenticatenales bacterium]